MENNANSNSELICYFTPENVKEIIKRMQNDLEISMSDLPILGVGMDFGLGNVCLEENENGFKFYIVDRGSKFNYEEFKTVEDAINRLGLFYKDNDLVEDQEQLKDIFYKVLGLYNQENNFENIKKKYDIKSDDVVLRLVSLKKEIKLKKEIDISYDELLKFLDNAMNSGDMQIWLLRNELEEIGVTLEDKLKKFFELNSNEKILVLYDIFENRNEKNIDNVKRLLKRDL